MSQPLFSIFFEPELTDGGGLDSLGREMKKELSGGRIAAAQTVSSEPAVQYIRERILDGTYPPGSFLSAKALAKELEISRTPVRDALRILEAQGLVEITPRLGATVPRMTDEEISDLLGLRCVLEAYCAYLAAQRRTVRDLAVLDEAQEKMEEIAAEPTGPEVYPGQIKRMAREDYRFHWQITQATKNRFIIQDIERSRALMTVFSTSTKYSGVARSDVRDVRSAVCEMHRAILEGIRNQDAAAARRAMERHLSVPEGGA